MPRRDTQLVCGTLILLSIIGGVFYLIASGREVAVALAFMAPIVAAVLAASFVAQKVDGLTARVNDAAGKADTAAANTEVVRLQTNGSLDKRFEAANKESEARILKAVSDMLNKEK